MPQRTIKRDKSGAVTTTETPFKCETNLKKKSDEAAKAAWSAPKPAKQEAKKVEVKND